MSHHPYDFNLIFRIDEKRAEMGVPMSCFPLYMTSQYIIHRIACSRLSVSWDEWKEKGAREKRRGRTGRGRGGSPFSLFFSVCLFACFALVFLFARSHLPRVWNSYQKHIRKDWRWTPPLISSLRLKKKIEKIMNIINLKEISSPCLEKSRQWLEIKRKVRTCGDISNCIRHT